METIELMDIYAMDRGICRIVARMTHENLNPLCHKKYNSLNLKPRNELTRMGLQEESVTQELVFSILESHRRITPTSIILNVLRKCWLSMRTQRARLIVTTLSCPVCSAELKRI